MTPLKLPFHFVNSFDSILPAFVAAVDYIDWALTERQKIDQLCQSELFQRIYRELGSPTFHNYYQPIQIRSKNIKINVNLNDAGASKPSNKLPSGSWPHIERLQAEISQAPVDTKAKKWHRLKKQYVESVLRLRCRLVDTACALFHRTGVWILVDEAKRGRTPETRRKAFLKLVEVDSAFLATPVGLKTIREAEITGDSQFKIKLAVALVGEIRETSGKQVRVKVIRDSGQQKKPRTESPRNRHMVEAALSLLPGKGRPEIAQFFSYYQSQLGKSIDQPASAGNVLPTTESQVRSIIKTYRLKRVPGRPGRPVEFPPEVPTKSD